MPVTVDKVKKIFHKSYPKLISKEGYQKPMYPPTRWAVLHGPCYGEKKFTGTLLIDLSRMLDWSLNHAEHTWTTLSLEQEAKEYFPGWLNKIDLETDAITILDKGQYGFLKDYYEDFVNKGWHQIYCPECKVLYQELDKRTLDREKVGSAIFWTADWRCVIGHRLYKHTHSIRIF